MYLLEINTLIKQLLPPHWRGGIKETMLRVLLYPLIGLHQRFLAFRSDQKKLLNISGQVLVLDGHIKDVSGSRLSNISSGDDFTFVAYLPAVLNKDKLQASINALEKYKPAGISYNIEYI